jgi:hypothetical protein
MLRECFVKVTGLRVSDQQWAQAKLGMKFGGLGLRSPADHSTAAFVSSLGSCNMQLRTRGAPLLTEFEAAGSEGALALALLNAALPQGAQVSPEALIGIRQQVVSRALDNARFAELLASMPVSDRAQLLSECGLGAYGFLQAVPNPKLGLAMDPDTFCCSVAERLCMQILPADDWCPLCDAVMDQKLRHAHMCVAGGERTARHHGARNIVFQAARASCLNPELEKSNILLPARPDDDDASRRRPADVYIPTGWNGPAMALDLAVTAPTRQDIVVEAARTPLAAATDYSAHKRTFLDTASQCQRSGLEFVPLVAESTGSWSVEAIGFFRFLCKTRSRWCGRDPGELLQELLQQLSVSIRTANARAVRRRMGEMALRYDPSI